MTKLDRERIARMIRQEYYKEIISPETYTIEELDQIADTAIRYESSIRDLEDSIVVEMEKYYERGVALEIDYYGHNPNIRQGVIESYRETLLESLDVLDVEMGVEEIIDKCHENTNSYWLKDLLRGGNESTHFREPVDGDVQLYSHVLHTLEGREV